MHFDKKTSDFNEEQYINCITEDDGLEHQVSPVAAAAGPATAVAAVIASTAAKLNAQPPAADGNASPAQMHNCDKCNYSSSYKGNVVSISIYSIIFSTDFLNVTWSFPP